MKHSVESFVVCVTYKEHYKTFTALVHNTQQLKNLFHLNISNILSEGLLGKLTF